MSQVTKPILLDETGQAINATLRGIYGKMSGTDISDGDVEAGDMLLGKIGYNADGRVVGTIPSKAAATITPSTSDQTIAAGQYLSGAQTIKGDANLVAENIKKDVEIFGITGTCGGGTTVTLFAPVISISEDTLTIASASNGAFAEGFYIYANGTLLTTVQTTTVDLSSLAENGDIITAKAYGTNFNDSAASNSVEYVKIPLGVNWATDSWASVQKTSKQGKTAEIYGSQVGATRNITLTNGSTMTIRLSNATNNMYSLSDGSRTTGLCMEFVDCFPDTYVMNSSATNVGGWNASQMRTVTMAQLYDLLPADLKAVIATVDIKASSGGVNGQTAVTSQDQLFLLAEREIFATRSKSAQVEWDALTRWQWYADHDTDAERVKKRNGSATPWWERSALSTFSGSFCRVESSGAAGDYPADRLFGVSPGFCI